MEAAGEVTGSGVWKASNDNILGLLVDVDGLDLDESNLFPVLARFPYCSDWFMS